MKITLQLLSEQSNGTEELVETEDMDAGDDVVWEVGDGSFRYCVCESNVRYPMVRVAEYRRNNEGGWEDADTYWLSGTDSREVSGPAERRLEVIRIKTIDGIEKQARTASD